MNIVVHHPTDHIFDCYRESSIMVSTSLFEPFGLVIPESMSCGLPVVAYDCPYGPASIVSDGENGFLIKCEDIEAFTDKVCLLMDSIELRKKMGTAGVIASKNYEPSCVMPLWIDLFHQLLNR